MKNSRADRLGTGGKSQDKISYPNKSATFLPSYSSISIK
jgi:hypothetical protein